MAFPFPSSFPLYSLPTKEGKQRQGRPRGALVWSWVLTGRDLGAPEWARLRQEAQAGGNCLSRLRPPAALARAGRGVSTTVCQRAGAPRSGAGFARGKPGETELRPGTLRELGHPAEPHSLPPVGEGSDPAVTAVRAAAAASSPLPLRGSRRRGRRTVAAPTGVVDVQLIRDALVASSKDDHQLPDGHRSVSVPGAGDRPREGRNPPPVEEAGSRHLPNPRPSAHNALRPLRRRCSRGRAGTGLQLCAWGGGRYPKVGDDGHVTAGVQGKAGRSGAERGGAGQGGGRSTGGHYRPYPRATCLVWAPGATDFRMEGNLLLTSLPSPPSTCSFMFAGEDRPFPFTVTLTEHLRCASESDPLNNDSTAREKLA